MLSQAVISKSIVAVLSVSREVCCEMMYPDSVRGRRNGNDCKCVGREASTQTSPQGYYRESWLQGSALRCRRDDTPFSVLGCTVRHCNTLYSGCRVYDRYCRVDYMQQSKVTSTAGYPVDASYVVGVMVMYCRVPGRCIICSGGYG